MVKLTEIAKTSTLPRSPNFNQIDDLYRELVLN